MSKFTDQSNAIISIYNAANDSDCWNTTLDVCVDYVEAHSANILFHDNEKESRWKYSLGSQRWRECSPEQMSRSIELFEKYDIQAWKYVHKQDKQSVFVDTDFWTDTDEIESREDYLFFQNELGFLRKAGSKLNDNQCWTDNIAFQFPPQYKTIPQINLNKIGSLLPHAAKSIELWRTFSILKSHYNAILSALDHVKVGLCVAEPSGSVIVVNDEAKRIFEATNAIGLDKSKKLKCRSAAIQASIRESLESTSATASGENSVTESFHVVGDNDNEAISIELSPLRDVAGEISSRFGGTLITLIDMSSDLNVDCKLLALAYKLSRAETEVCTLITHGFTAQEIADFRNVSIETINTQTKSIYSKTGVKGRLELVRLLFKSSPPIS